MKFAVGLIIVAPLLASKDCTIGCGPSNPVTVQLAGPDLVPIHEVSPCKYAPNAALPGKYPTSKAGFFEVDVDGLATLSEPFLVDPSTGYLVLQEPWCSEPTHKFELFYYRWYRTANE